MASQAKSLGAGNLSQPPLKTRPEEPLKAAKTNFKSGVSQLDFHTRSAEPGS